MQEISGKDFSNTDKKRRTDKLNFLKPKIFHLAK